MTIKLQYAGQAMNGTVSSLSTLSSGEAIALSVTIFVVMIASLLGNLLIISAFIKSKSLFSRFANKLVLSLAVTDLATAFFLMNYQQAIFMETSLISSEGILCTIGGLSSYTVFLISILTMVMLSVDRFIALGYPLTYNLRITSAFKIFMLVYPWVHGILFGIFCGVFIKIKFDARSRDCGLTWKERHLGFTIFVLVAHLVLPFALLAVLNIMTLRLVRCQNRTLVGQERTRVRAEMDSGSRSAEDTRRRAQSETKLAKISMAIVLVFVVCWIPYVITRALDAYCCHVPSLALTGAVVTIDLTSLINPIIYSSLRSDLRQSVRDLLRRQNNVIQIQPVTNNQPQSSQISSL